jgi:tRNA pseudouridine38-40 synthase
LNWCSIETPDSLRGPDVLEVTRNIVLIVEYDGTSYHGFQWQANAPTIQAKLEDALARLTKDPVRIHGASRTDSGAHARGQVVSFRVDSSLSTESWRRAFNFYLPEDIAVIDAYEVDESFDVRRHATSREYAYRIVNRPSRSPVQSRFAHWVAQPLHVDLMNEACEALIGEQDLAAFTPSPQVRTVRTILHAGVRQESKSVIFDITANSFLPYQIRSTVGGLIRVGLEKLRVEDFWRLARSRQPGAIGPTAPARGLCLMKVNYPDFPPRGGQNENL